MRKYAKVVNKETKLCEVGLGTDTEFYASLGMTEKDVEQDANGDWYLIGYAPTEPSNAQEIAELKQRLEETDYVVIKIAEGVATAEEYADIIAQRQSWRARINELEG